MIALLDINVLVALAWPNHVHHTRAHERFRELQPGGWATSPATQAGFVRVSSNRRVVPDARSPAECILLLRRMIAIAGHIFWTDDVSLADSPFASFERLVGYRQVTDAHLLTLAHRRAGRLATFDQGIASLVPRSMEPADILIVLR